ncbi:GNAT family N-acetyltransferase [Roseovarius faecimaris]|uniref:GNAT family N-acetyltransferase n=1 Tax=Roseovarius faecimaris TaxID=2494550 RepID=A0A6I6IKX8_9RHOB|nr:GNAT family N-acetyltransferase [Roseovarius faecimaris]QGX97285.1 GNAT family N-acetyltransferase [Roseovarius faecimaris]
MTPEVLAALHSRAFAGQGRGWSAQEFGDLLAAPHVFCVTSDAGFALGRALAGEAELLTLAVDPAEQRAGHGAALLSAFEDEAAIRGASRAFLDVSAQNTAALALYRRARYHEVARRAGYYHCPGGGTADALILAKDLP